MKKILFVLHLPPPVHGAAMVGDVIRGSAEVNEAFDCRYINLSTSDSLADIGKVSVGKLTAFLRLRREVRTTLREFQPDLVYVTAASTGFGFLKDSRLVGMIKRMGFPVVVHFHNKGVAAHQDGLLRRAYAQFFDGIRVIQLSERLYPDIARFVPRERVFFCPNGTEDPGPVARTAHAEPHVLFLSNLIVSKGVLVLLDACKILNERGVPFVLDIAGNETAEIPAGRLAAEVAARGLTGAVVYHGGVGGAAKEALLREADVFTLPSFSDCFPLVLLEAMARSLPVVSTEEGAIGDIVSEGETGFLVARQDAGALADALGRLLADPLLRERQGAAGRLRFERAFTRGAFLHRFVEILQSL